MRVSVKMNCPYVTVVNVPSVKYTSLSLLPPLWTLHPSVTRPNRLVMNSRSTVCETGILGFIRNVVRTFHP